tara:strand:- start:3303 stop:4388 length:1086 start_codon:yes stop_codon:yes gene_type:complete
MRLALFISSLDSGGAERALSELANYWSTKGHKVHLCVLTSPDKEPFYPLHTNVILHHLDVMTPENTSFFKRYFTLYRRIKVLRHVLKSLKPDVILSFMDVLNVQVIMASLGLGRKVIACERTNPFMRPLPCFYKILRKGTYPFAKIVVQTKSVKKYFSFLKAQKVYVIPNTLTLHSSPLKTFKKNLIVSVGRLDFYKGFDLLIKAFHKVHQDYPDYKVYLYGKGPDLEKLSNLVKKLGLQSKIHFKGTTKNIEQALAQASLFVFPSRFEGFPNALTEALAMGLPCLASDIAGCNDLIQHNRNGLLFESENIEDLTHHLRSLLSKASLRTKIAKNAVHVRDHLSPDRIYPLWDALLPQEDDL